MTELQNVTLGVLLALTVSPASAGEESQGSIAQAGAYSPYVAQTHPNRVYWGDSGLHTSYSWDAGLVGNTVGPDAAYRFAKGEQVTASSGRDVKLIRALDWLVVADHSQSLGVAALIERSDPAILESEVGRKTHDV